MIGSEISTFASEEALNTAIEAHRGEVHKVIDGEILKGCDHLAAFVEAFLSLEHGISSKHLTSAIRDLKAKYTGRVIGGVDFGSIYDQFKPRDRWFEE